MENNKWETADSYKKLIDVHLYSLKGYIDSPFYVLDYGESALKPLKKKYIKKIIKINKLGFMTIGSQENINKKFKIKTIMTKQELRTNSGYFLKENNHNNKLEGIVKQIPYIEGFLPFHILEHFKEELNKKNYIVLYSYEKKKLNNIKEVEERYEDHINLTKILYKNYTHYTTNCWFKYFDNEDDNLLRLCKKAKKMEKWIIKNLCYVMIIFPKFETKGKIYRDVLKTIKKIDLKY